jgi:long-chain fatty acid transport protein
MNRSTHIGLKTLIAATATSVIAVLSFTTPASATEGYFQPGYSANQKALAGTGVANADDAMTIAVNPAGLTAVGHEFEFGLSLFSPSRQYTVTGGPGFVAPGTVKSGWKHFVIPNFAYSQPITANSSWGIAIYGNGGMNTNYAGSVANPACGPYSGVYCGGKAGVNLNQVFISGDYAWRTGNFSFGIAPILAIQMFDAKGLGAFSAYSISPGNLTNRGISYSWGGGARLGMTWNASPTFRVAVAGNTPIWMSKFDKYKGLFANGGAFDIPASVTAGVAWDAAANWTLMADYKHIFYSDIPAVSDSTTKPAPFGSANGPGFGWSDVDVISVGAKWRVTPHWTLRAGYAHNNNPIGPEDVTLNILAPGVITNHISAGVSHKFGSGDSLDFSVLYAPQTTVSGIEMTPTGPNPGRTIKLAMHQWDITLGYRFHW